VLDGRFGRSRRVPADPARRLLSGRQTLDRLARSGAGPSARDAARQGATLDYAFDAGPRLRGIVLDTVRRAGGSSGTLSPTQRAWLGRRLAEAGNRRILVFSHHPLDRSRGGAPALRMLERDRQVAATVSGHTHRHEVSRGGGLWRIATASLADFPQQARVLRLVRLPGGREALETYVVDHPGSGEAGIARELAHLDAQGGRPQGFAGERDDRNRRLALR
jgi:hypothetical protein